MFYSLTPYYFDNKIRKVNIKLIFDTSIALDSYHVYEMPLSFDNREINICRNKGLLKIIFPKLDPEYKDYKFDLFLIGNPDLKEIEVPNYANAIYCDMHLKLNKIPEDCYVSMGHRDMLDAMVD
jgi:hypothetical protein